MKKNKTMRLAALLLVLTLVTCCFVGGTFAKYISVKSAEDTATVAKWSIQLNNTEMTTKAITFDLFNTVYEANTEDEEDNVVDKLLAPGTGGSFTLNVANKSEVTAKYTIALSEASNDNHIPLQYSLNKTTWKDNISELEITDEVLNMNDGTNAHTVYWRWVFEGTTEGAHTGQTDENDTALGIAGQAPTVTITATLTATQVD